MRLEQFGGSRQANQSGTVGACDITGCLVSTIVAIDDVQQHSLNEPDWCMDRVLMKSWAVINTGFPVICLPYIGLSSFLQVQLDHFLSRVKEVLRLHLLHFVEGPNCSH